MTCSECAADQCDRCQEWVADGTACACACRVGLEPDLLALLEGGRVTDAADRQSHGGSGDLDTYVSEPPC